MTIAVGCAGRRRHLSPSAFTLPPAPAATKPGHLQSNYSSTSACSLSTDTRWPVTVRGVQKHCSVLTASGWPEQVGRTMLQLWPTWVSNTRSKSILLYGTITDCHDLYQLHMLRDRLLVAYRHIFPLLAVKWPILRKSEDRIMSQPVYVRKSSFYLCQAPKNIRNQVMTQALTTFQYHRVGTSTA